MKENRASQRYAKAILDLAKDQNVAEVVNADMKSIAKTLAASNDLMDALASPVIKANLKKSILQEVFKDVNGLTKKAFDVLIENNRIVGLKAVAVNYTKLYNVMHNIQVATVTTAFPLDAFLEEKIQSKVKELTGNTATLEKKIDPNIIGGFILRIGDLQYNASVSKNLLDLKREFRNNTYISKLN